MSKKEKLIKKLLARPKDFTCEEMTTLLGFFDFDNKSGSGSGLRFIHRQSKRVITFHRPHPEKELKNYVLEQVIEILRKEGFLDE